MCLPVTLFAQIVTGGTDAPDKDGMSNALHKMTKFSEHLKRRDKVCGQTRLLKRNDGIMQIYLKLSLLKQDIISGDKCDEEMKYFQCLANQETVGRASALKESKTTALMLSLKFNISIDQAHRMLIFYGDLGSK
jgi:hypothetical protein